MRRIFGGSWDNGPRFARVAFRLRDAPDYRLSSLGLRVARTPMQRMGR